MNLNYKIFSVIIILACILTILFKISSLDNTSEPLLACTAGGCAKGYVCDASFLCGRGEDCSSVKTEGDLLCHKSCQADSDCPSNTPICSVHSLFHGDYAVSEKFCTEK